MPLPLDFSLEGALRKTSWLAERAFGVVTTRVGLAVRVKNNRLRSGCETRAARKLHQVSGRNVGCFWTAALMVSRCCDRLSCWLESEPCKNLSTRPQTYSGCESVGTANEHKTATRIRPGSDQAYCHAESKTKSRDSKMVCQLPIRRKLGEMQSSHSSRIASTAKSSGKQRTKTVNRDAGNIPAKENSESEHNTHCGGSSSTCPSSSSNSHDRGRPRRAHCSRCCSSDDPVGCTGKNVANREHRDEKPGGHQRPRWNGRHLSCRCPDVTCLLHSCPCKHFSTAPCAWLVGCHCLGSLLSLSFSMISFLRTTKRPLCKTVTDHNCDAPARQIHAARWIGNRRHSHIRMRHRKKTSHRRKQDLF